MEDREFDRAFVQHQIEHHDEEVRKLTTMQSTVQDPEVREFVESTLDAVQQHLQRLQQISTNLTNTQ
jgi:predicted outer membrane protein